MKDRVFLLVALVAGLSLVTVGCEGGGGSGGSGGTIGGGTCGPLDPCGGNPVGTWRVAESCYLTVQGTDTIADTTECTDVPVTLTRVVSGSVTYTSTQEQWNATITDTYLYTVTSACIASVGGPTCAEVADTMGCTCTGTSQCQCNCSPEPQALTDSYPYTVQDLALDFGDESPIPFCIEGVTMRQWWDGGNIPMVFQKE